MEKKKKSLLVCVVFAFQMGVALHYVDGVGKMGLVRWAWVFFVGVRGS